MCWVKDGGGLLRRVSPFRDLRIVGYLLLPEAFRSLSRLSSALSAKASTIRSFMHDQQIRKTGCFHIDTDIALSALVLGQFFSFVFFESCIIFQWLPRMSWSRYWSFISCMRFSRYILTELLSVIKNQNLFWSLITGKTSYHNSTALLTGLALISCCSSLPVFMIKDFSRRFRFSVVPLRFPELPNRSSSFLS